MHILVNANLYGAGGRETHLLKLCRALVGAGVETTVALRVANNTTPFLKEAASIPVRIVSTPFASNLKLFKLSTLWALIFWRFKLRRGCYDILYSFDISRFTSFLMTFVSPQGRLILTRAGDLMTTADWSNQTIRRPDAIVVESELQAQAVRAASPFQVSVMAIPLLGHYERRTSTITKPAGSPLRVSFLGRWDENKGAYRLLNVWSRFRDRDMKLSFYGHGNRKALCERISALGLSKCVSVEHGWQSSMELTAIFENTDFVVLPSYSEGLPIILLEAMAQAVPFVATNVGAIGTLAKDNPDVLVVGNDDQAIAEGIEQMAAKILAGQIDCRRLQQYHQDWFSFEKSSQRWLAALVGQSDATTVT